MKKSTIVIVVIIILLLLGGLWYMNRNTETSFNESSSGNAENAGQAPALETDEQVFNEFDSAITGVE